jgi:hypothetical protein
MNANPYESRQVGESKSHVARIVSASGELRIVLRDWLIGMALFLFASLAAGSLSELVSIDYPNIYAVFFGIGLIPFFAYAHMRKVHAITARGATLWPSPKLCTSLNERI